MSPGFNLEDYEPVADRIAHFWKDHPDGRILTSPVYQLCVNGQWVFRAEVYTNPKDMEPSATGYAEEQTGEGMVNRMAALENCETSAIGRALANAGYSTSKSRASREEMQKVRAAEESPQDRALQRLVLRFGQDRAIEIWNEGAEAGKTPDEIVTEALAEREPEIDHGPHRSGAENPPEQPVPTAVREEVVESGDGDSVPSDPDESSPAPTDAEIEAKLEAFQLQGGTIIEVREESTPEDPGEAWSALVGHLDWHPDVRTLKDDTYAWTKRLYELMAVTQLWPENATALALDRHHPELEKFKGERHLSSLKKDEMLRFADQSYLAAQQRMAEDRR